MFSGNILFFGQALVCKSAESKNSIEIEIIILKREQEAAFVIVDSWRTRKEFFLQCNHHSINLSMYAPLIQTFFSDVAILEQ
jgi:hypothetical protein